MTPPLAKQIAKAFHFTGEDTEKLLRIIAESLHIKRHVELYLWLQGEMQHFLPHPVLISAWGDFDNWKLKLDVTSALPGVRTEQLAHCGIDATLKDLFTRWVQAGRKPLLVPAADALRQLGGCACAFHSTLRGMHSVLAHGVRDERGGYDSLYIVLHSRALGAARGKERFASIVDLLITQIDAAFRRVAAFNFAEPPTDKKMAADALELSAREHQIVEAMCKGKTNIQIAAALEISPFTVKNHVRRILKKLGSGNRAEAAAKYSLALSHARKTIPEASTQPRD